MTLTQDDLILVLLGLGIGLLGMMAWRTRQPHTMVAEPSRDAPDARVPTASVDVADLAKNHYWGLANYAGVLAGALDDYLKHRAHHLFLHLDGDPTRNRASIRERLDTIAKEKARETFPYLCQLVSRFDRFHFKGSNTYLLTNHEAGEVCKQLYNAFLSSLPTNEQLNRADLYAHEVGGQAVGELEPAALGRLVEEDNEEAAVLRRARDAWQNWLRYDRAGVSQATDALLAYNEILLREMAALYQGWFDLHRTPETPDSNATADGSWPYALTEPTRLAVERFRDTATLLAPLGSAASTPRRHVDHESTGQSRSSGADNAYTATDRDIELDGSRSVYEDRVPQRPSKLAGNDAMEVDIAATAAFSPGALAARDGAKSGLQVDAFICYSRQDLEEVKMAYDELRRLGRNCWMDLDTTPGTYWDDEIESRIRRAKFFVFFFSDEAKGSLNVKHELATVAHIISRSPERLPILLRVNTKAPRNAPPSPFAGVQALQTTLRTPDDAVGIARELNSAMRRYDTVTPRNVWWQSDGAAPFDTIPTDSSSTRGTADGVT